MPEEKHFEKKLISPLEYYQFYRHELKDYLGLVPPSSPHFNLLTETLAVIITHTESIDSKLKEEEGRLQLLAIQNNFTGDPVIFTSTRKLVKEGEIERLKKSTAKNDEIGTHIYYAHLFNDAFVYSAKNRITGKFKLHTAV